MKITVTMDFNRDMSEEELGQFILELLAQAEEDEYGQGRNLHDFRWSLDGCPRCHDDDSIIVER